MSVLEARRMSEHEPTRKQGVHIIERHTMAVAHSCDEGSGGKGRCRFGDLLHDILPVVRRTDDSAHRTTKDTTRREILS